jgi:hypothetical protein
MIWPCEPDSNPPAWDVTAYMPRIKVRRLHLLLAAFGVFVLAGVVGCLKLPTLPGGVSTPSVTDTPHVIYVTPTPEGYQPEGTATLTPNVIYVTATPGGEEVAEEPSAGSPTPFVIYITATPLRVGPFGATPAGGAGTGEPTLDLSNVTPIPTARPTQPGEPTATAQPTATPPPVSPTPTSTPVIPQPREGALYSSWMGINFISSAQHQTDEERFDMGLDAGAGWDRFAIYWNEIEQEPNSYHWGVYDEAVRNDVIYGLRTDAILLGTPDIYASDIWIPAKIHEPVFADGGDEPENDDSELNPNNPWAEFVYNTVRRYKPGGTLARRERWPEGAGIRVWEIWNEPDFRQFWPGSSEDYARLLKVAYIAAHHADPDAQVVIGGLVSFEQPSFLIDVLDNYRNDPNPVDGRYPFDVVALHAYSHPAYSFYTLQRTETLLATHDLEDVPVWLNESGVTVWNDYPGPTWATSVDQVAWRASLQEQADYIIQNASFALLGGAAKLFHFQLYDDCGNQPRGTTFPPNDGSLCDTGAVCWGDALGLVRNREDNVCFNQHPEAGTPRPSFFAYRVVAEVFGDGKVVPLTGYTSAGRQWMIFARPESNQIITVLWDESGQDGEIAVQARSESATLIRTDGSRQELTPEDDGAYHIFLSAAHNRSQADRSDYTFMIGGSPVILVEQAGEPVVTVLPLLDTVQSAAIVKWRTSNPGQISRFEVYYRDDSSDDPEWVLWIESEHPGQGLFVGGEGRAYSFFARGLKADGQWTAQAPYPQAWTTQQ